MRFTEYQRATSETAVYPDAGQGNVLYPTLGLSGEAGEVADQVKRVLRDDGGTLTDARRQRIAGELGDVLWYAARLAEELGTDLDRIAQANLDKLRARREAGAIHGEGEQR